MDRRIVQQLVNFAATRRAEQAAEGGGPSRPTQIPRAALAALALLPFRRLFTGASVSSKIQEFVYTFH